MNVLNIPVTQKHAGDQNPNVNPSGNVIKLEQIKSILYLGIKGNITPPRPEAHEIDTFA